MQKALKMIKNVFLLSQGESLVTVKFFDPEISTIFDISDLPESKYRFLENVCVCVCACVCVRNKFVRGITRNWTKISSLSLAVT